MHCPSDHNTLSDTDNRSFYRRGEFSDMRIEIPGYYGSVELDAHKVILAAKSGYFRRELKLPKYNVNYPGD
jgi:hypothetical protein